MLVGWLASRYSATIEANGMQIVAWRRKAYLDRFPPFPPYKWMMRTRRRQKKRPAGRSVFYPCSLSCKKVMNSRTRNRTGVFKCAYSMRSAADGETA